MSTTISPYTHAEKAGDFTADITDEERQYYGQLIGATIHRVVLLTPDEDDDLSLCLDRYTPVLLLKTRDGRELQVELLSDEEGNGAGFADIRDITHPSIQHT